MIITSNNEKELPDAFLRRCVFHFIDFPDATLMRRIVDVHHPNLDAKLLDQVLIKFYWLREQQRAAQEPVDQRADRLDRALLRARASAGRSSRRTSRSSARCSRRSRTSTRSRATTSAADATRRAGPTSARATTSRRPEAHVPRALLRAARRGRPGRDPGVADAPDARSRRGCTARASTRFYHLARACLVKSETYFDAFDRVFARVFHGVEGALGDDVTDELLEWLRDPKNFPELTPEQRAALERLVARRADAPLPRDARRAERAPRRRRPLGRHRRPLAVRPRRRAPDRASASAARARSRSAMKVAEERRFRDYRTDVDARPAPDARSRCGGCASSRATAPQTSSTSTRRSTRPAATPARSSSCSGRRASNNVRLLLLMDVGGSMDPYYEPVSRLLTALHEERGLRDFRAYYFHNCVYDHVYTTARLLRADALADRRPASGSSTSAGRWRSSATPRCTRPSCSSRTATSTRGATSPTPGIALARSASPTTSSARCGSTPTRRRSGTRRRRRGVVRRLFPMFHLSVDGLAEAVAALVGARKVA